MRTYVLFLAAVVVAVALGHQLGVLTDRRPDLADRVRRAEEREAQLRDFVVRHARPLQMTAVSTPEQLQQELRLMRRRLDPETLTWEEFTPHFGVDRSKLDPRRAP